MRECTEWIRYTMIDIKAPWCETQGKRWDREEGWIHTYTYIHRQYDYITPRPPYNNYHHTSTESFKSNTLKPTNNKPMIILHWYVKYEPPLLFAEIPLVYCWMLLLDKRRRGGCVCPMQVYYMHRTMWRWRWYRKPPWVAHLGHTWDCWLTHTCTCEYDIGDLIPLARVEVIRGLRGRGRYAGGRGHRDGRGRRLRTVLLGWRGLLGRLRVVWVVVKLGGSDNGDVSHCGLW